MAPASKLRAEAVDLTQTEEWDRLFATYWEACKHPLQVIGILTFPWLGEGSDREMDTYNAAKADYLEAAKKNADQRWLKIEDHSVSGKPRIIGGGAYSVIRKAVGEGARPLSGPDPGTGHNDSAPPDVKIPGPGYALGSERNVLMRQLYSQMWSWRPRIMTDRPHLCK